MNEVALDRVGTETGNGTAPTPNWRDAAMNHALRGFDNSESMDALLQAIRIHTPDAAIRVLWLDRLQVLRFVEEQTTSAGSLLSGSIVNEEDEKSRPYLGWLSVAWEGEEVEIVFLPGSCEYGTLCLARSEALVWRFGSALEAFAERPTGRCMLYSEGWRNAPEMDAEMGKVTWDDLVLAPPLMTSVRESIEGFCRNRDAYAALGFPWRRGVLLIGPPGTGKTMICKAAAAALPDWPFLYVRDLREYNGHEAIESIFERARKLTPCILAFEDIDGLINPLIPMNRTVFLNELDGFRNNEGLLIIASSNHPGQIDEALLKRPSRFDRVFHIGLPERSEREAYCLQVLSRSSLAERMAPGVDLNHLSRQVAERSEGFTPAYLKEALVGAALQRAQEGAMALDERFASTVLEQVEELRVHLRRMKDPDALAELGLDDGPVGFRR